MNDIETLKAAIRKQQEALAFLEQAERIIPEMQKRIGTHYRYRTCYSCPDSEADYWWVYCRIVGVRDSHFRLLTFQVDAYHELKIEETRSVTVNGYDLISEAEFRAAVKPMLNLLRQECLGESGAK